MPQDKQAALEECWLILQIEKTSGCLVVDAVSSEPVSVSIFPANREFNREITKFWAVVQAWSAWQVHNSLCLATATDHRSSKRTGNFFETSGN